MVDKKHFEDAVTFLSQELAAKITLILQTEEEQDHYTFGNITIDDDMQDNLRKIFLKKYEGMVKYFDRRVYSEYDSMVNGDDGMYLKKSEVESPLLTQKIKDVKHLTGISEDDINHLWGHIITFSDKNGKELRVFTKFSKGNVLRKSKIDALMFKSGTFKPLEHDVFKMDYKIHAAAFGDYVLILAKYQFEQLFELEKLFDKNAKNVLKEIKELDFEFTNFDTFQEDCLKTPGAVRKLSNIKAKKYYESLDYAKVKKMKKNYKLTIEIDDEKKELKYETYKQMWEVLHLLDDSLLHSELTDYRYEVSSKTRRS